MPPLHLERAALSLYWLNEWSPKTWVDPQCGLPDFVLIAYVPLVAVPPLFAAIRLRQAGKGWPIAVPLVSLALLLTAGACIIGFLVWFRRAQLRRVTPLWLEGATSYVAISALRAVGRSAASTTGGSRQPSLNRRWAPRRFHPASRRRAPRGQTAGIAGTSAAVGGTGLEPVTSCL
jgi:hypothetical protein